MRKTMKKLLKFLTSKVFIIGMLLLIQLAFIFFVFNRLLSDSVIGIYVHTAFQVLSVIVGLHIISNDDNPVYKIAWLIPTMVFPVFGTFFYIFYQNNNISKSQLSLHFGITKKRFEILKDFPMNKNTREISYLSKGGWPGYENTNSYFMPSGEEKLKNLLIDLEKAEDFIFLEYFIITDGVMFNDIFDILKKKARQGVTVKVLYDDFGSADRLPRGFRKNMEEAGAKIAAFNPMKFQINFAMNYRDHRKIVIIDGKVGYTGGINIGDEYTNKKERFGYWHDAAIKIEGQAVWSLTLTFLESWAFTTKTDPLFEKYFRDYKVKTDGLVLPFADSPLDKDLTTRNTYLYLIGRAKDKIWVTSPYLILDNELLTALKLAALSGVDVSIIIPHIPDKKLVYIVTQSYIPELVEAGVKIYRFTPGFIHSKLILVDDEVAIVGTSNLDFRSLYLHYENNILLYNTKSLKDINDYFTNTLDVCHLVTKDNLKKRGLFYRMLQAILKGFAPLL